MLAPISSSNVTSSASIKTHGSETRTAGGQHAVENQAELPDAHGVHTAPAVGMSGNTALSNVGAVTATAGSRTVLQLLAFAVAAQLNMARRSDESLEAFFLRIATTIDKMSDTERASIESRSGLKALNIRLTELADALKRPDGTMAARIVALAETPKTPFVRAAAAAATNSYLQEGLATPRAVEAFSIEAAVRTAQNADRPADAPEADARALQNHLQSMFEPDIAHDQPAAVDNAIEDEVAVPALLVEGKAMELEALDKQAADPSLDNIETEVRTADIVPDEAGVLQDATMAEAASAGVVEALREDVVSDADQNSASTGMETPETLAAQPTNEERIEADAPDPRRQLHDPINESRLESRLLDKSQQADKRLETMLVLKGFAEVVHAEQGGSDHIVSQPDPTDSFRRRVMGEMPARAIAAEALANIEKAVASATAALERHAARPSDSIAIEEKADDEARHKTTAAGEEVVAQRATGIESHVPSKTTQHIEFVPFAHVPAPPAKDGFEARKAEDERRRGDESDEGAEAEDGETPEERRERLGRKALDELLDTEPEELETIAINRDSSESDRAYAMYQRMGGF